MTVQPPTLVSLLLLSDNGQGHVRDYNVAVGQAARLAGWSHRAALVTSWHLDSLPADWEIAIDSPNLENFWSRNMAYGRMAGSLARYVRGRLLPGGQPIILFVENLSTSTLIVLAQALRRLPREDLALWVLFRFNPRERGPAGQVMRLVLGDLRRLLRPGALQLLTDSQPLARSLTAFTGQPATAMPIPHIDFPPMPTRPGPGATVVAWWPGAPRLEKGPAVIRRLASLTGPAAAQIEIVAAAKAGLVAVPGGPRLRPQASGLSRAEYVQSLADCDVVLLPYDPRAYRERTSGIFVEAVAAARLPLVTPGTWMAGELAEHHLTDLILDWQAPDLPDRILSLAHDPGVNTRLRAMQTAYMRQHGPAAYAEALQRLVQPVPAGAIDRHAHHG